MESESHHFRTLGQLLDTLLVDELTLDDLCRVLVMQTFNKYGATQAFIFESHPDATYSLVASYGAQLDYGIEIENLPLSSLYPSAACIRNNSIVTTTHDMSRLEFPDIPGVDNQSRYGNLTVVPLRKFGAPIGAVSISSAQGMDTEESADFLELVASMVATRFSQSGRYREISIDQGSFPNKSKVLNERETLIQVAMSKGFTNPEIAVDLGFSESTIRQDSMSLFRKLGVTNRRDAGKLLLS